MFCASCEYTNTTTTHWCAPPPPILFFTSYYNNFMLSITTYLFIYENAIHLKLPVWSPPPLKNKIKIKQWFTCTKFERLVSRYRMRGQFGKTSDRRVCFMFKKAVQWRRCISKTLCCQLDPINLTTHHGATYHVYTSFF